MAKDCGGWSLAGVLGDVEIEYFSWCYTVVVKGLGGDILRIGSDAGMSVIILL